MAEIEWMQKRYGIMVHFLSCIMPRDGEKKMDWEAMTANFPMEKFCDEIAAAGAGWVIFPFGQNTGYYCSSNEELEKYWPGKCSKRDLMMDLALELQRRGIRLIAYMPSEIDSAPEEERKVLGWDFDAYDKSAFMDRYTEILRCWSRKFRTLISGWWFDGCYDSSTKPFTRTHTWNNSRIDYKKWKEAAREGNAEAVIAMCPGAEDFGYVTKEQDYLAGEANSLKHICEGPLIDGMQWHCLVWLDCFWMHKNQGKIEKPRFNDNELSQFMKQCFDHKGGVTLNVGIYEDGSLAEETMEQIRRVVKRNT